MAFVKVALKLDQFLNFELYWSVFVFPVIFNGSIDDKKRYVASEACKLSS